jgi:peptide deformylase
MQVVSYPAEILRRRASVIPRVDSGIRETIDIMMETMKTGGGIGLAAPQVGLSVRLFVTGVDRDGYRVFINPEILEKSRRRTRYEESCLSLPDVYGDVSRSSQLRVRAWDKDGEPFELTARGMLARVIQHENDHLNGILFVDHLAQKRRERILKHFGARR